MNLSKNTLSLIFGDAFSFCGKEDVIHGIIYHRLRESGLLITQIAREQPISKPTNRVDLVTFDKNSNGQFKSTSHIPQLAIEVKGGAYNVRNALKDEISSDGYCKDMAKLEREVLTGIESWFICIDMPQLGRSVSPHLITLVHKQCEMRGISFAYYCQGEDNFYHAPMGEKPSLVPVYVDGCKGSDFNVSTVLDEGNQLFNMMCEGLLQINGHEANTVAALYHLFRCSGYAVNQLSLETYFSFAKRPGSTMHDRPDMVLFDSSFDGMFNLYKNGNASQSNDAHKLEHINTVFEVKGSATMNKKGPSARLNDCLSDLAKLDLWKANAGALGCTSLQGCFLYLDGHRKPLPSSAIEDMVANASGNKVIYLSSNGIELY